MLSYFDEILGPRVFRSFPIDLPKELEKVVLNMMEIRLEEKFFKFFTTGDLKFQLYNYLFSYQRVLREEIQSGY